MNAVFGCDFMCQRDSVCHQGATRDSVSVASGMPVWNHDGCALECLLCSKMSFAAFVLS